MPVARCRSFGGFIVTAVVSALLLSACGGSGSVAGGAQGSRLTSIQLVQDSVQKTTAANTADVHLDVSVSGTPSIPGLTHSGSALDISVTGSGIFDFAHKVGQMTIDLPAIGSQSKAQTITIRLIGADLYMSSPALTALDGGKPWIHVSVSDYMKKQSQSEGPLGGFSDGDPTEVLNLLKSVSGDVHQVGTADIGGVPTTQYQGSIDLSGTGGSTSSTIISKQMAQSLGLSSLPVDVWIDGSGRARQIKTSFSILGLSISATEQIGDFGTPVSVSAPPPDQTTDGSSLLNSGKIGSLFT